MSLSSKSLPQMSELHAFEAAARHASFSAAAAELSLTQSAVSRQIRSLESQLGADLFIRERQKVFLTVAGHAYAEEVRQALQRLSKATLSFQANPQGGTLNVAILPTFGTRWLAPRLPDFMAAHPGVTINLTTRLAPFDFRDDSIDAAVHFGQPEWVGAELDFLMGEVVLPACSQGFKATHNLSIPADIARVPLLHLTSRPNAWKDWFTAAGVAPAPARGMLVDQFAMVAQAATAGLGVALLPAFLIQKELANGELVEATDVHTPGSSDARYYLAYPPNRMDYAPLVAFRQWLLSQAAKTEASTLRETR